MEKNTGTKVTNKELQEEFFKRKDNLKMEVTPEDASEQPAGSYDTRGKARYDAIYVQRWTQVYKFYELSARAP